MEISLNGHEARVLGVLIEKGYTTPDQYPLSLNGATNGSNQRSNRDPVVDYSEAEVRIAMQGLRMKGLVGVSVPSGSRVEKYRHNAKETLKCGERELAVLAELLVRGPQTASELKTRASRMREIASREALAEVLESLVGRGLAKELPGGRAPRWQQLLCTEKGESAEPSQATPSAPTAAPSPAGGPAGATGATGATGGGLEGRVEALEARVAELTARLDRLSEELGA